MDTKKTVNDLLGTGLTQQQLADLVPCGQSTINALSLDKRGKRPSLFIGMRLAELHAERCQEAKVEEKEKAEEAQ